MTAEQETMDFDILIIGAGPAGLSAAIKLKQLQPELTICLLEKGAEVGAHILSGAIIEPSALNELLPDWQQQSFPNHQPVTNDEFYYLTDSKQYKLPTPPTMHNQSNFIISLSDFCKHLAQIAENLGVEIYPGFAATEILYNESKDTVVGVKTGDMGIGKDGNPTHNYQSGMALLAKNTLFAEGCRGSLSKQLISQFKLDKDCCPQTYGLGFKEIWRVKKNQPGLVTHTVGWPMDNSTYGGAFLYHFEDKISIGYVIGLDYQNPWLSPYDEFQRFKIHPFIKPLLEDGERLTYGAKALIEGGVQSIPQLTVPGASLIGDSAGFLNVAKIKGSHTAMKSGILAAEAINQRIAKEESIITLQNYANEVKRSSIYQELYKVRNVRPAFQKGLFWGLAYSAIDQYFFRGAAPWTFKHKADHATLKPANQCAKIKYPKPDGKITFDKLSSVFLAGTFHEEEQPSHLKLTDPTIAISTNHKVFASPETRYCPAGVYEIVEKDHTPHLQINAQNCIHCKTCDIKDPKQNIIWHPPEGGGGPNYQGM